MSLDLIHALRALAEAAAFEGNENRAIGPSEIALSQSRIYSRAADSLEEQELAQCGLDRRGEERAPSRRTMGRPPRHGR